MEFVNIHRNKFVGIFGESDWRSFGIFLSYAADKRATGQGFREAQERLTGLLAQRGVSLQQARADKRKFREIMTEALEAKNPLVAELVGKLRAGGRSIFDDLTFVKARNR